MKEAISPSMKNKVTILTDKKKEKKKEITISSV